MPITLIFGGSGGDEGKAKIVDYLARDADFVVRYMGGANAGHTVMVNDEEFGLHLVNTGIFHSRVTCLAGAGMVIDPWQLLEEIEACRAKGAKNVYKRFRVDPRAHIVFPNHIARDNLTEAGVSKIGSTKRGIAYAYSDKTLRIGVRFGDLLNNWTSWFPRLEDQVMIANQAAERHGLRGHCDARHIKDRLLEIAPRLIPMIADISVILEKALADGKKIFGEGAQGALLDIDHGTYPHVTSSNPTVAGAYAGMGIGPQPDERRGNVIKAYTTFVGERDFPWEMEGPELAERVRKACGEYGTTTGRPRRLGWFSGPHARYARRLNQPHWQALTKLDCYGKGFLPDKKIKVVKAFEFDGKIFSTWSADITDPSRAKPIFGEEFDSWHITPAQGRRMKCLDDLPREALKYVQYLEELIGQHFDYISTSPHGDQMIVR